MTGTEGSIARTTAAGSAGTRMARTPNRAPIARICAAMTG